MNIYSIRFNKEGENVSRVELLTEIERLRLEMNSLALSGTCYLKVLEVSQRLDELIVLYHRTAA